MKRDLDSEQLEDADLAGPFVFAMLLGACLLLRGPLAIYIIFIYLLRIAYVFSLRGLD
jgi:hypothetical protein